MKKTYLILILAFLLSFTSNAQDYRTSLGLRAGVPVGVTVKHFLNETNAIEGILASRGEDLLSPDFMNLNTGQANILALTGTGVPGHMWVSGMKDIIPGSK